MPELLAQAEPKAASSAKADWLYGFWYPALRSNRVRGKKLAKAMVLSIPLVLGRKKDDQAFALRDSCPHRGIPLSYGSFDGEQLQCCYHGWCFEPRSGQCREIPSLTEDSKLKIDRIFAAAFPCDERDGFFWVFIPEPGSGRSDWFEHQPPVSSVPTFSVTFVLIHHTADLPCSVDH